MACLFTKTSEERRTVSFDAAFLSFGPVTFRFPHFLWGRLLGRIGLDAMTVMIDTKKHTIRHD